VRAFFLFDLILTERNTTSTRTYSTELKRRPIYSRKKCPSTMPKRSRNPLSSLLLARKMMLLLALLVPFVSAQETTLAPTGVPSMLPSQMPSDLPSLVPSQVPSNAPSTQTPSAPKLPTTSPTGVPHNAPTGAPSTVPTGSAAPTGAPSSSGAPSGAKSAIPSQLPTSVPSSVPTGVPSSSGAPSDLKSGGPSQLPTSAPSSVPTGVPSLTPTAMPSKVPTFGPTTNAPTSLVVADVFMVLRNVAFTMEGDIIDFFNQQCTTFFQENLEPMEPRVSITESRLEFQRLLPEEDGRRRRLQSSGLRLQPLETRVVVMGMLAGEAFDFDELLQSVVNANATGLIDLLREPPVIYFRQVDSIAVNDGLSPTDSPTQAPTEGPTENPSDNDDDDDGLGTGAIIGIAVGGAAGLVLMMGAIYFLRGDGGAGAPIALGSMSMDSTGPPGSRAGNQAMVLPSGSTISATPSWKEPDSDIEISAAGDNQSLLGGQSYMGSMNDDLGGADTMSYAYSLDAGYMEPSLASGPALLSTDPASTMVGTMVSSPSGESVLGQKPNQVRREVIAPPGKLGIVIDTTIQGPVIHKVNKNSPLQGILFPGDIITAIDATDTRSMTAAAITALMVQTANQQRRLTVVTDESQ
jgi:hypothetical protein